MSSKRFLSLKDLSSYMEELDFNDTEEPSDYIDIVLLPPDDSDSSSDEEDFDEHSLEDTVPNDVPGPFEVHGIPSHEAPQNKKIKKEKITSDWQNEKASFTDYGYNSDECERRKLNMVTKLKGKSPVEIFELFFDDDIQDEIVRNCVLYAAQNNLHQLTFSKECLKKFIGILLLTGYRSLPQTHMYWSEAEDLNVAIVRNCMPRNRFMEIKRYLHFADNTNIPIRNGINDKIFKIRPIIDALNNNYMQFGVFSDNISIGEQVVPYHGQHYLEKNIKGKPVRIGFKQWAICCAETGFCYNVEIYEGKSGDIQNSINGLGMSIVLNSIDKIEHPEQHCFYFDNFFTSFELMKELKDKNIRATGKVRHERMNDCPIKNKIAMKKEYQGALDYSFDKNNEIFGLVWKNNNIITVLSNHQEVLPLVKVSRWSKVEQKQVSTSQPNAIAQYNKFVGGVDKMDCNIQKYRIKIRDRKWYFPLFTNAIDMAVVNAHVLYTMANNVNMPLLDFRRVITRAYLTIHSMSDPKISGRPSYNISAQRRVPDAVRKDPTGHYLERTPQGKQRKCAICKNNVRKQCIKCDVGLHVECVKEWHSM